MKLSTMYRLLFSGMAKLMATSAFSTRRCCRAALSMSTAVTYRPWSRRSNCCGCVGRRPSASPEPIKPVSTQYLPGPTGELNRLETFPRPPVLCLGPGKAAAKAQAEAVTSLGGQALAVEGRLAPEELCRLPGFGAAIWWGEETHARAYAQALAERDGPIIPLITDMPDTAYMLHERHLCVDTTAAGGNASLLAGM